MTKQRMALALIASGILATGILTAAEKPATDPALERTRKNVRMLDDLYKTAVVLITEHYVNEPDDVGAGPAALLLFDAMKKKGWHEVRLLDATGQPSNEKNAPADGFERAAIDALNAGQPYHEAIIERDGRRYLRAATIVPVVMKKCTMCHAHYEDVKPGAAVGALSYTLPIE